MIGNVYIAQYSGISIKLLAINVRAEDVLSVICHYIPSMEEYNERPLTGSLTLYEIKTPKEKEIIKCYFSTRDIKTTVSEIKYFED